MLSHSLLSVRELPTFFSWSPLLAEQRSIDWWLGIETSLRVVGLKVLGSYFEHKTTLSVSTSVRHYSLLLPAFFCPEKKKENVNTASEQADNKNCFGSSFPQWSPLYSSLFFSANTSVFGGVVSFREPLLAERVTLKLSSLDRELWGLTWEAWDLLLCWQEQGGGSAQIRSSADAAGCHTQILTHTHIHTFITDAAPHTHERVISSQQEEHSVPVDSQHHQQSLLSRNQLESDFKTSCVMCQLSCELYLGPLDRWGRCCPLLQPAAWWRSRFCGTIKATKWSVKSLHETGFYV